MSKPTSNCILIIQGFNNADTFEQYNYMINISWQHMMKDDCQECKSAKNEAKQRIESSK